MRPAHVRIAWLALALPFLVSAGVAAPPPGPPGTDSAALEVSSFSPQGTVKGVRQVKARFSAPMTPLGDPRGGAAPFEIRCAGKGTARWVDSRSWVFDFARDLPAGLRCDFTLRAGLRALDGRALTGQRAFSFSTGGPAVREPRPFEGSVIEEEQVFLLGLDAEADEASVLAHVSFSVKGLPEPIGARIVRGPERAMLLRNLARWERPDEPLLAIRAARPFPQGTKVSLVWGKGVTTKTGVATDQDQVIPFEVRRAFTAEFRCERENKRAKCIPVTPMELRFSAPVAWTKAREIALTGPDGKRRGPKPPGEPTPFVDDPTFEGPFPESAAFRIELPPGLTDDAGRALANADKFPMEVRTDPYPPLAKFQSRFAIVESKADPALPVTLRNLEPRLRTTLLPVGPGAAPGKDGGVGLLGCRMARVPPERMEDMIPWLRKVSLATRQKSVFGAPDPSLLLRTMSLPRPDGPKAFEVVGIPMHEPGLYVVEIASPRLGASLLGKPRPLYVQAAALVTNMAVHFKWGREGSLAWVTSLDRGRPVGGAQVSVHDCRGKSLWSGVSDANGIARIPKLADRNALPNCQDAVFQSNDAVDWSDYAQTPSLQSLSGGLYVAARKNGDASFVHSSWEDGIEPWRFGVPSENWQDPIVAHTILDRSLLRAGDTVHMKHLLRAQTTRGFSIVPSAERPTQLKIVHGGSGEEFALPLLWDASGIAENEWAIPKGAKLGVYNVVLERKPRPAPKGSGEEAGEPRDYGRTWIAGQFRVEEFRVPLMRGTIRLPAEPQVGATSIAADVAVQYLAGGAAARLPTILRAQVTPAQVAFDAFEGFTFGSAELEETMLRRPESEEEGPEPGRPPVHQRSEIRLDAGGTARIPVTNLPRSPRPQSLLTELEFRDPNGAAQTVSSTITLWPSRRLVGIKPDGWVASRERVRAQVAVVDVTGRPLAGIPVAVDVFENRVYSIRKRLVGGFYGYDHVEETKPRGRLCAGVTGPKGIFICEGKPAAEGNLALQATARDEQGRAAFGTGEVWVAGSADWWFRSQDNDRIDLLPEKKKYEPGDVARLQVRMPFRKATALVTTEREGVIDASVVTLSGKEPVIEVPVRANDAPNVYVSALVVRGRVGGVQPTAMVDLGRPAWKLGIAELRVGWAAHALKVEVSSPRSVYQVREKAPVRIHVRGIGGAPPPAGSELTIAAVDEGLLELSPNPSWDLLDAMMGRRAYDVRTSTAQMQVVGKRHYGRKALPHGGGGGRQSTRELFDTLLLWKGRVPLDAKGEASVEIPLNDSLTSFRIVAIASGGADRFGTGALSIRTTQDLMLLSGVPPFVREGDRFHAEFTLRNTTARPLAVDVTAKAAGLAAPLAPQRLAIAAGESAIAAWEVIAPGGIGQIAYEVEALAGTGISDRLKVAQRIGAAIPVRTLQATIVQLERTASESVKRPAGALPDRGGVQVAFQASLAGGMAGVEDHMRAYPYTCLEQEVSRAVALGDRKRWDTLMATLPTYLDSDGLLRYFPSMTSGSEILTTYVMQIAQEAGWPIPGAALASMQAGLAGFVNGTIARTPSLPVADLSIRKVAALEALARYGKADPKLLESVVIEPNLWPTSAVIDWWSLLRRVPSVPGRDARMREAEQIVRSRLDLEGTVMKFSSEERDDLWWLMVSSDVNALRLMLLLVEGNLWKPDLPRILRGALGRQRDGAWDLTVANAWGVLAVKKFAAAYEKAPVTGESEATLAAAQKRVDWSRRPQGETLDLPWPVGRANVLLMHTGSGRPWVTISSRAAVPLRAPVSSGYRVSRSLVPVERRNASTWSRGDIARVRLDIDAQSDMTWVVVSDPVPGGASHLGTGLARESRIAQTEAGGPGSARPEELTAWPAFEERSFESFRAYFEFLPKGHHRVEYVIRLNQDGVFQLPPTRVEALYSPEMFGEAPNAPWEIRP